MKLYEAPRNSIVKVIGPVYGPPEAPPVQGGEEVLFIRLDGMYSFCKNENGDTVYLPAAQEVELME